MRVLASWSPGEVRVAAVDPSGLVDLAIWRPGAPDGVGDLHRARIFACVPAMAGAFVRLEGGADGFLPDSESGPDGSKRPGEGAVLGVRVSRAAQGGKGPRLTARLSDAERALVGSGPPALIRRGPGAVERLAALHPAAAVFVDDPALAAAVRPALGDRLQRVRVAFDDAVEAEVAALAEPSADLPGGARLSVHPTPALTAIDVDLGAASGARATKARAQKAANLALLPTLARQIRLRNLSGAILVDLGGMSVSRRVALGPALADALAGDPGRPRFLGFTALGLAEIVRPRIHPPLHEMLAGPHAAGLAALRACWGAVTAAPHRAPALRAAPDVVAALRADPVALADFQGRAGRPMSLRADPTLPGGAWLPEE
jgi:Ribonuclease G/E